MTWIPHVLSLFLRPDEAETVAGDLIEEYRDSVLPSVARWRADVWLVRQVAGFVWRAPLAWGLVVAILMSGRFALDTFAPPDDYGPRAFVTTWAAVLTYLSAGAWGARRTGLVRSGALTAAVAHAMGWTINGVVTVAIYATVIRHQPAMADLFRETGDWGEIWWLPLLMMPAVLALGSIGGACGKALARRARA